MKVSNSQNGRMCQATSINRTFHPRIRSLILLPWAGAAAPPVYFLKRAPPPTSGSGPKLGGFLPPSNCRLTPPSPYTPLPPLLTLLTPSNHEQRRGLQQADAELRLNTPGSAIPSGEGSVVRRSFWLNVCEAIKVYESGSGISENLKRRRLRGKVTC